MGNRLTKIYTRTGDDGSTGSADGSRSSKAGLKIQVIGELDELNCCIGLIMVRPLLGPVSVLLSGVQHKLFDIGGALSGVDYKPVNEIDIQALEQQMDGWNGTLPALKEFILPGGGETAARCHFARAVCRRLERSLVAWQQAGTQLDSDILAYINRLSDCLFVLCRILSEADGEPEVFWQASFK